MGAALTAVDAAHKERAFRRLGADRFVDHEARDFAAGEYRYDVIISMARAGAGCNPNKAKPIETILARAFGETGFESVTVRLPPTRQRVNGLIRMGFEPDDELEVDGERFKRYCFSNNSG